MELSTNRVFNSRLIYDEALPEKFRVANSFWDWLKRIISWIWSPSSYSAENRLTLHCFKKYLLDTLGEERLQRICTRYSLDLEAMEKKGSPLLSRHVAKIVIGARNVSVEDINDFLQKSPSDSCFSGKNSFLDLDSATLAGVIERLSDPFEGRWKVADIAKRISGRPTEWIASWIYDPFSADRERLEVSRENPTDSFEVFMHNMVARVIKREMDVGTLVPAPNHPSGRPQFYYVSGKLISGEGMISYIFHPATADTNLEPMRLFRGTAARNSEIDGVSTVITDLEPDLGRTAYESGLVYEPFIREKLGQPRIEGGHSLGATLVQYRLASELDHMNHIEKAYLFCGPGVPRKEAEKFNRKNPKVHLFIRRSTKDPSVKAGEVHLGHQAPSNVQVDYWKYHAPRKKMDQAAHVAVWGREKKVHVGIEGGMPTEKRNREFYHKDNWIERLRSTFGPPIARRLRSLRNRCRSHFSSRAELEQGLKIGSMQKGRWHVDHFKPTPYTSLA